MTKAAEQLLKDALALDTDDLSDLIDELIVNAPRTDKAYTDAWEDEIQRRLEDVDAGRVEMIPADEAVRRLRESGNRNG